MRCWLALFITIVIICEIWHYSAARVRRRTAKRRTKTRDRSSRRKGRRKTRGKSILLPQCDDCSKLVQLRGAFEVGNVNYTYAHVSTNGYIVLWPDKPENVTLPKLPPNNNLGVPLIAPFWANITTKIKSRSSRAMVKVFTRRKSKSVNKAITRMFRKRYSAKKTFSVKWYKVPYAGGTRFRKRNTFEVVLSTDYKKTYVVFHYYHLTWSYRAMAGIIFGDKTTTTLPFSQTSSVTKLVKQSNIIRRSRKWRVKGLFVYRVDNVTTTVTPTRCAPGPLELSPRRVSLFGGSPITVSGPCFRERVSCRFDKIVVHGIVVNHKQAICITPELTGVGIIPVSVSLDGGSSFTPGINLIIDTGVKKSSLKVPSSSRETWGDLVSSSGRITWPKSYFRSRRVNVVYKIVTQSDDPNLILVQLKKAVRNTGSLNLSDINLGDQSTLHPAFVGALGIQEGRTNGRSGMPLTLWSVIRPASWYFNMYVKESIKRAQENPHITSKYRLAAEAVMGRTIWRQEKEDLMNRFTQKSMEINERFFKDSCSKWVMQEQVKQLSTDHLPACPCNLDMAKFDERFQQDSTFLSLKNGTVCERTTQAEGGDQQCCYGHTGELLQYAEGGGSVSRFSATRQPLLYMLQDHWPKIMCGQLANKSLIYPQLRPTDDCNAYVPLKQGAGFGIGHTIPFKGGPYRFIDARGQFWIIRGVGLSMQGKMVGMNKRKGQTTDWYVWQALVMKSSNSDTIEIQASAQLMDIYVNGVNWNLSKINEYPLTGVGAIYDPNKETVTLRFNHGKGFVIQVKTFGQTLAFYVKISEYPTVANVALYKPACMSSTSNIYPDAKASKAVDGIMSTNSQLLSCSRTQKGEGYPWWQVDLVAMHIVLGVTITGHGDTSKYRLEHLYVDVLKISSPVPTVKLTVTTCNYMPSGDKFVPDETRYIPCRSSLTFKGRFVRITKMNDGSILILCDVQVHGIPERDVNIAKDKPAIQSSTMNDAIAWFATDGNVHGLGVDGQCSVTTLSSSPWWKVDLANTYRVDVVVVVVCGKKSIGLVMRDITVDVLSAENQSITRCGMARGVVGPGDSFNVRCTAGSEGRFVTITSPGRRQRLSLNEVQVYGGEVFFTENLVLTGHVSQSSTDGNATVSLTTDGNMQAPCSSTKLSKKPWWWLYLRAVYVITSVTIFTPKCCEQDFGRTQISAYETVTYRHSCAYVAETQWKLGMKNVFTCMPDAIGRYVFIVMYGTYHLKFCEVQVKGTLAGRKKPNLALGKYTSQSSTYGHYTSYKAVDGQLVGGLAEGFCSMTTGKEVPWWQVVLDSVYDINMVTVTATQEYISIIHEELGPTQNLALGKPTSQGRTPYKQFPPYKAVDGNQGGSSCAVSDPDGYWMVDLKAPYVIWEMALTNRGAFCCAINLAKFTIETYFSNGWQTCTRNEKMWPSGTRRFRCDKHTIGAKLRIAEKGKKQLHICEVQVFGLLVPKDFNITKNLALGRPTYQEYTPYSAFHSSKAVDGNLNAKLGSCTVTNAKSYWQVDLGSLHDIWEVVLTNRGEFCCAHSENIHTLLSKEVAEHVNEVYGRLGHPELLNRCRSVRTQNSNETLHSVVWNKCPKTGFVGLTRVVAATCTAVAEFNQGVEFTVAHTFDVMGMPVDTQTRLSALKADKAVCSEGRQTSPR